MATKMHTRGSFYINPMNLLSNNLYFIQHAAAMGYNYNMPYSHRVYMPLSCTRLVRPLNLLHRDYFSSYPSRVSSPSLCPGLISPFPAVPQGQ